MTEPEINHDHKAWRWASTDTVYSDGGKEIRFGACVGAPDDKCFCRVYFCPHGVECRSLHEREKDCKKCAKL